jgi:hypothetical protein
MLDTIKVLKQLSKDAGIEDVRLNYNTIYLS